MIKPRDIKAIKLVKVLVENQPNDYETSNKPLKCWGPAMDLYQTSYNHPDLHMYTYHLEIPVVH